jgi:glycosyltransferase 2 family protein
MAEPTTPDDAQKVKTRNIVLSIAVSVGISAYLIATNFKPSSLAAIHVSGKTLVGLILAAIALMLRDGAFAYKVRLSSGEKLNWGQAIRAIVMWEFGAAITPKIGEVAFTFFVLKRSGLSFGRSTGVLVLNTFLDNVVFVVVFGLLYVLLGRHILTIAPNCPDLAGDTAMQKLMLYVRIVADKAWIGYVIFCALALFFGVALFALPRRRRLFFHRVSKLPVLHRFQRGIRHLGDEIDITAYEYKNQKRTFWVKMIAATLINWSARYAIVCALVFAFAGASPGFSFWDVYARQYVLWMFLIIPTTPGASGWAEITFIALNCEFLPIGLPAKIALAVIWRIYTYYLYLLIGIIVMPGWLKRTTKNVNPGKPKPI